MELSEEEIDRIAEKVKEKILPFLVPLRSFEPPPWAPPPMSPQPWWSPAKPIEVWADTHTDVVVN